MARLMAGVVFGLLVGVGLGAAAGIHAQDTGDEPAVQTDDTAAQAVDDDAAVETPDVVIEVAVPPPVPVPAPKPAVSGVWDRLAQCESRGIWSINTGNGYYGGLQEDMTFWRNHGGLKYASRPDLASREAQIAVAVTGQAVQGWGAWPTCSRILGLR
jgi:hypothetical protein